MPMSRSMQSRMSAQIARPPGQQAVPGEGDKQAKRPPLEIKEIEDLEDDAMGG